MEHSKEQNQRWIDEINKYVQLNDADLIIKMSLSYTLQSLRHGENIKRFQWGDKDGVE